MSILANITSTRKKEPPFMLIYGEHGVGKTTFGADAPSPIFIATEDGQTSVDADRFEPLCTSMKQFDEHLAYLATEKHEYKTLVIDSMDWLESIIDREIGAEMGVDLASNADWGKGTNRMADRFRKVCQDLAALRAKRGMAIIMLAHAEVKRMHDPIKGEFDRIRIKLSKKSADVVMEAPQLVGCAYLNSKVDKDGKVAITGQRVLMFSKTDVCDSKNRVGIRSPLQFTYKAFSEALAERYNEKGMKKS